MDSKIEDKVSALEAVVAQQNKIIDMLVELVKNISYPKGKPSLGPIYAGKPFDPFTQPFTITNPNSTSVYKATVSHIDNSSNQPYWSTSDLAKTI